MLTRQQRFWDRHSERVEISVDNTKFINVPSPDWPDEDDEIALVGAVWDLLHELANMIPGEIRQAVTVDLAAIDVWEWMERADEKKRGYRLSDEYLVTEKGLEAETKLWNVIQDSNETIQEYAAHAYPGARFVTEEQYQQYLKGQWPPENDNGGDSA